MYLLCAVKDVSAKQNVWVSFLAELVVVEEFKCIVTGLGVA